MLKCVIFKLLGFGFGVFCFTCVATLQIFDNSKVFIKLCKLVNSVYKKFCKFLSTQ